MLKQSIVLNGNQRHGREGEIVEEEDHLEWGWRRRRRRWVGMREMPIPPSVKARTKVLKVLILRSNHLGAHYAALGQTP